MSKRGRTVVQWLPFFSFSQEGGTDNPKRFYNEYTFDNEGSSQLRSTTFLYGLPNTVRVSMMPADEAVCIVCNGETVTSRDGTKRFCLDCAHVQTLPSEGATQRLRLTCPICQDELPTDATFCISCGHKVS